MPSGEIIIYEIVAVNYAHHVAQPIMVMVCCDDDAPPRHHGKEFLSSRDFVDQKFAFDCYWPTKSQPNGSLSPNFLAHIHTNLYSTIAPPIAT